MTALDVFLTACSRNLPVGVACFSSYVCLCLSLSSAQPPAPSTLLGRDEGLSQEFGLGAFSEWRDSAHTFCQCYNLRW